MDKKQIQIELRKLAKSSKHEDVADVQALAIRLRELEVFAPREVKLLVDAAKADVLDDLATPGESAVQGLLRERLASRILSESDASYEEARWAVETWAQALSGKATEVTHAQPARPDLTWDNDEPANPPNLGALRTSAPQPILGNAVPKPAPLPAIQPEAARQAPPPAATAAWPPPPLSYAEPTAENTSGTDGPLPAEVSACRWHWGAFAISFWWLRHHNLRAWGWGLALISFALRLSPYGGVLRSVGILVLCILLGLNGHKLAWQKRRYESVQQFFDTESKWAYWGIGITVVVLAINAVVFGMMLTGSLH